MKTKTLKTDGLAKSNNSPIASFNLYNLPVVIEEMKHESDCINSKLNSRTLSSTKESQISVLVLPANEEIKGYQSFDYTSIFVIEGKLSLIIAETTTTLDKGQYLELNTKVHYILKSEEETIILMKTSNFRYQPDAEEMPWCL